MKTIETLACELVAKRAVAAKLRREQKALFDNCEEPYDWGDGSSPAVSCGYWDIKTVGSHCDSCRKALEMGPQRIAAGKAKRAAMAALTRAVNRKVHNEQPNPT